MEKYEEIDMLVMMMKIMIMMMIAMDAYIKSTYLNLNTVSFVMSNLSWSCGEICDRREKVTPDEAGMKERSKEIDGGVSFETS